MKYDIKTQAIFEGETVTTKFEGSFEHAIIAAKGIAKVYEQIFWYVNDINNNTIASGRI